MGCAYKNEIVLIQIQLLIFDFHAKMGLIKDRNGMDLAEAEMFSKGGKNKKKNYTKKIFMTQIIVMV